MFLVQINCRVQVHMYLQVSPYVIRNVRALRRRPVQILQPVVETQVSTSGLADARRRTLTNVETESKKSYGTWIDSLKPVELEKTGPEAQKQL